jgi:hypothetical protein
VRPFSVNSTRNVHPSAANSEQTINQLPTKVDPHQKHPGEPEEVLQPEAVDLLRTLIVNADDFGFPSDVTTASFTRTGTGS